MHKSPGKHSDMTTAVLSVAPDRLLLKHLKWVPDNKQLLIQVISLKSNKTKKAQIYDLDIT